MTTPANSPRDAKKPARSGGELFIVDNSDESWKGLKYLQDWTEIASAFDIATGYFEISETIRLMAEIDAVIEKHGGWPLK
jgi:hypothetical protein